MRNPVLVVGGGPAGVIAALGLMRRGVTVRLIEQSARASSASRTALRRNVGRSAGRPDEALNDEHGLRGGKLRDGSVDVAYVWLPCDDRDLHLEVIATEPRFAGLATGHPLADREQLSIDELNDVPMMTTGKAPRFWVDWWAVNPRPDGSEVLWGPSNDNVEECFEQVADGIAGCICPASMIAYYRRPDLVWIPIVDVDPLCIALGWLKGHDTPLVEAFAQVVREVTGERSPTRPIRLVGVQAA